jgi:hypothetical protein
MKKAFYLFFCGFFFSNASKSQDVVNTTTSVKGITMMAVVIDGDTIPVINLPPVTIVGKKKFKNKLAEYRYRKLIRDVKKAYPFAKIAGAKVKLYNEKLLTASSEAEKKKLMKKAEEEIKAEFEDDVRDLTLNQGRILLKLIDRETGNNSYYLVKEFRGSISAIFWQSIARIFGNNLKSEYDPAEEDKDIEQIIQMIENGEI